MSDIESDTQSSTTTTPPISKSSTPPTPPDPETSNASSQTSTKKVKKNKQISRAPIATGISTSIPVTGEKPRPIQEGDASLEDKVLFSIFIILFEKDANEEGMTVKQLCEMLESLHPEMVNLSSKTSNLVSAKLNAYIKKLEKADLSLKYAISREWADASPKRMVYKYRGLLAPGWEKVLDDLKKSEEDKQQQQQQSQSQSDPSQQQDSDSPMDIDEPSESPKSKKRTPELVINTTTTTTKDDSSIGTLKSSVPLASPTPTTANANSSSTMKRRATMFDLGRPSLGDFCVPYNTAPVASLTAFIKDENGSDDEVLQEVLVEPEHEDNIIKVKKRRLTWAPLGESAADDLGLAAFRALSAGGSGTKKKWFELTEMPKPELTSLSELEKYWD
ncbi:GDS1 Protein GDS1 [Candida maltosa Xu316]